MPERSGSRRSRSSSRRRSRSRSRSRRRSRSRSRGRQSLSSEPPSTDSSLETSEFDLTDYVLSNADEIEKLREIINSNNDKIEKFKKDILKILELIYEIKRTQLTSSQTSTTLDQEHRETSTTLDQEHREMVDGMYI